LRRHSDTHNLCNVYGHTTPISGARKRTYRRFNQLTIHLHSWATSSRRG